MGFTQRPLSLGESFGHEHRNALLAFFSDGDGGTPSISVQAANTWYDTRDTFILRFVADGCRKNLPLSVTGLPMSSVPDTFPINHDDYHAKHIGRTADGRQFFLTTPFDPALGGKRGCEFIALFMFDSSGAFLDAQIDNLGPRASLGKDAASKLYAERLASLGDVTFGDIRIAPFKTEQHGLDFGLFSRECEDEDEDDEPVIELHPGNYMAFFDPWDGDYDT